nr:Transposase [Virgibacillus halodenitrificans]
MSKFTEAIKLQVVKEYASGKFSYRELAKYYEVDESVIRYWELLYRHHGENAFNFTYTNYPAAFKLEVIEFINEKITPFERHPPFSIYLILLWCAGGEKSGRKLEKMPLNRERGLLLWDRIKRKVLPKKLKINQRKL